MRIYFAGSIVGSGAFKPYQQMIVEICERLGHVVVSREHAFKLESEVDQDIAAEDVYERDMWWLVRESEAVIGELSVGSYGVGFELGTGCMMGLPVLGLVHEDVEGGSAFVEGNTTPGYTCKRYSRETLEMHVTQWLRALDKPKRGGLYVAFEGLNSCGKGTQIGLLEKAITKCNKKVVCVREPGTTFIGESLRTLLQMQSTEIPAITSEVAMLMAQRAQLVAQEIVPNLEKGTVVVADRSEGTSLAFQGLARNQGILRVAALNGYAVMGVRPDLVIYLRTSLDVLRTRDRDGGALDRFEEEGDDFEELCFKGYEEAVRLDRLCATNRWMVIDASNPVDVVHDDIWSIVEPVLERGYV